MLSFPDEIKKLTDTYRKNGFEAYIVGGCVRDLLLNKTPNDYDITTNALPENTKRLFRKTVDTGIKHGTVTVVTETGRLVEVTTYRTEDGYSDMRRPENVTFVGDIKEDLSRRDFTVNAMAYNEYDGLIDCFGGEKDLKNKILRAVGNPEKRFSEDALRIMRLVRFSSTLDFKAEKETEISALRLCKNLKNISAERVATELFKTLDGNNLSLLSKLIKKGGLEAFGIKHLKSLKNITLLPKGEIRFFALLRLTGSDTENVIKSLKLSNQIKNYCKVCESLMFLNKKSTDRDIKYALSLSDISTIGDICRFKTYILREDIMFLKEKAERIIKSAEPYKISHLALNGNDLTDLGIKGENVGKTLNSLCEDVRKNPENNTREKLLNLIKKL